ncbi:MAG: hypothetical protein N3D80_06920 [Ignavibacterium album]|uniref:hypothetical protein n=1 Tax=Ignavibacterium album TaxID=591197 RepID=UPI0026F01287|nr:hypothetical protein [Ignavibacterium album]MCX8105584.1 hypothetical protein [Ignavibacterium album]
MKINNKNSESIIRYFDGDLKNVEKEILFNQIQNDADLKAEFESIKSIYELKSDYTNIIIDQSYLDSILPRFRSKLEKKSRTNIFNPAFASAFATILIALAILFLIPKGNKTPDNFSDIPDEELFQLLSHDNLEVIQQDKIDSLFRAEIKSSPDKISNYVFNGDEINTLYQKNLITPEDEDEIFTSLIDKKF